MRFYFLSSGHRSDNIADLIARFCPDISNMQTKFMDWESECFIQTPKNSAVAINDIPLKSSEYSEMEYSSVGSVLQTDKAVQYYVEFHVVFLLINSF